MNRSLLNLFIYDKRKVTNKLLCQWLHNATVKSLYEQTNLFCHVKKNNLLPFFFHYKSV
jgi:hypothetical protein